MIDNNRPLDILKLSIAVTFTIIFTFSGVFLIFTLVFTLDSILDVYIEDPWEAVISGQQNPTQAWQNYESTLNFLRPIAYICFLIILVVIILGFIVKKYNVSFLGAYTLYIPLFGSFSFAMSVLFAGIGVIRIIWLPFIDTIPELLNSAALILLPIILPIIGYQI